MKALKCIDLVRPSTRFDRAIKQMLSPHSPFCSFPFRIQHMAKRLRSSAFEQRGQANRHFSSNSKLLVTLKTIFSLSARVLATGRRGQRVVTNASICQRASGCAACSRLCTSVCVLCQGLAVHPLSCVCCESARHTSICVRFVCSTTPHTTLT
jgi:hypothetical protein